MIGQMGKRFAFKKLVSIRSVFLSGSVPGIASSREAATAKYICGSMYLSALQNVANGECWGMWLFVFVVVSPAAVLQHARAQCECMPRPLEMISNYDLACKLKCIYCLAFVDHTREVIGSK